MGESTKKATDFSLQLASVLIPSEVDLEVIAQIQNAKVKYRELDVRETSTHYQPSKTVANVTMTFSQIKIKS